jgi:hypothetical protein
MKHSDIKVGKTYCNRGKGTTTRRVIGIAPRIGSATVLQVMYRDSDGVLWRIDLKMFAKWAGGIVDE